MKESASTLSRLYAQHVKFYKSKEQVPRDRARRYYNGYFFEQGRRNARYANRSDDKTTAAHTLSSINIIYAITDTALALLVGNSLGVAMNPQSGNRHALAKRADIEAYLDYVFRLNKMRKQATTALIDAILDGRGVFKTYWDKDDDVAKVRTVKPSHLMFDLEAREPENIGYWMEITPLTKEEWCNRVKSGRYKCKHAPDLDLLEQRCEPYPDWLDPTDGDYEDVRKVFDWIIVVEYYDTKSLTVKHWVPSNDLVVFEGEVPFIPYSLFDLSSNGRNCLGLSEVQLVLDDQESANLMKTLLNEVACLSIPRTIFDDAKLDSKLFERLNRAPLGAFVPAGRGAAETPGGGAPLSLDSAFFKAPTPESPQPVKEAIDRAIDDASRVTAFADQSRGQAQNVRTATEMAFMDVQLQTRTANRKARFYEAVEDVAQKMLAYAKRYLQRPVEVRKRGRGEWTTIDRWLAEVEADFQCVAYNPLRDNPAVLGERLMQIMPIIGTLPDYDQRAIHEFLLDTMHLPSYLLRPRAEVEAEMLEAAQAQAAQAAPTAMPEPTAEAMPAEGLPDAETAGALVQMGADLGEEGMADVEALAELERMG